MQNIRSLIQLELTDQKIPDFKKRQTVVKALCLHIAHDCNLACKYCFIESSPISNQKYKKMSFETAKIAVDKFLSELEKNKIKESQIIFYGGEPLTNFEVVKDVIKYIQDEKKQILH